MYRTPHAQLVYRSTIYGVDAIEPTTGQSVWSWASGMPRQPRDGSIRVDVRDGQVFFLGSIQQGPSHYRALVCLDGQSGAVHWVFNLEPLHPTSNRQILLAFHGELVILTSLGSHANTAAISRRDGRCLWARQEAYESLPVLSVEGASTYYDRTGFEPGA